MAILEVRDAAIDISAVSPRERVNLTDVKYCILAPRSTSKVLLGTHVFLVYGELFVCLFCLFYSEQQVKAKLINLGTTLMLLLVCWLLVRSPCTLR